jgi:hypothetical protein
MKSKTRGVKRMGITEVEALKRLVEVSRGTVVKREWSNGRSRPPVESWERSKQDVKERELLLRELWMIKDDQVLDKLEKEGVHVQSRRNTQESRWIEAEKKRKQKETSKFEREREIADHRRLYTLLFGQPE